ncbi:MAG: DUF2267 domain-containing protein [Candidatus Eisenbacteria bacterium]|nr:DUF2267 domain-containing protein [Candidatus Eisenbacteria bacterium]
MMLLPRLRLASFRFPWKASAFTRNSRNPAKAKSSLGSSLSARFRMCGDAPRASWRPNAAVLMDRGVLDRERRDGGAVAAASTIAVMGWGIPPYGVRPSAGRTGGMPPGVRRNAVTPSCKLGWWSRMTMNGRQRRRSILMRYEEFLTRVQKRAELDDQDQSDRVTKAVLGTLGECLYRTERENLAAQLPDELKPAVFSLKEPETMNTPVQGFSLEEFNNRVSARADIGYPLATKGTRGVFAVLREAVSPGQMEDVRRQLTEDYEVLFV